MALLAVISYLYTPTNCLRLPDVDYSVDTRS